MTAIPPPDPNEPPPHQRGRSRSVGAQEVVQVDEPAVRVVAGRGLPGGDQAVPPEWPHPGRPDRIQAGQRRFTVGTWTRSAPRWTHSGHTFSNRVQIALEQIRVHVQRHRRRGMAQHPLHHLRTRPPRSPVTPPCHEVHVESPAGNVGSTRWQRVTARGSQAPAVAGIRR